MISICSCAQKIGSWYSGQACEYMISPIADNSFKFSCSHSQFVLQHFLPMLCAHATNIKKLWHLVKLLHENTSNIEISFWTSLIRPLWMLIWHEIQCYDKNLCFAKE